VEGAQERQAHFLKAATGLHMPVVWSQGPLDSAMRKGKIKS